MPHLFVNRHRIFGLVGTSRAAGSHFVWESINATLYIAGGVAFVAGSLFLFPALSSAARWGVWAFVVGSLLYVIVTVHDLAEVVRYRKLDVAPTYHGVLELLTGTLYLTGSLLFVAGRVVSADLVDLPAAGPWYFIVGSTVFIAAAAINVSELRRGTGGAQRLFNLTAVTFVVGSTLFLTASVPYLWPLSQDTLATDLSVYLAAQYLVGSVLFLIGGLLNYRRAWMVVLRVIHFRDVAARAGAESS